MSAWCGLVVGLTGGRQGVAMDVSALRPPTVALPGDGSGPAQWRWWKTDEAGASARDSATAARPEVVLALDEVWDPHNLGAMLRTAASLVRHAERDTVGKGHVVMWWRCDGDVVEM